MKIGTIEANVTPMCGGTSKTPYVILQVKAGWFANDVTVTPDQAREFAALLVLAANVAEGK